MMGWGTEVSHHSNGDGLGHGRSLLRKNIHVFSILVFRRTSSAQLISPSIVFVRSFHPE
jgi:hypothetical protein